MAPPPTSLGDARRAVLNRARPLAAVELPLAEALGRWVARDVVAGESLQPFDNSAMDGYAVRAADLGGADRPVALTVVGESRAGHPAAASVGGGETIAISTGAMLPDGADAVVRVEDTRRDGDRVEVLAPVGAGTNLRRAGEDVAAGETVLRDGDRLGPAALGLLAALGVERVACGGRPRVALVSSGDELAAPGEPLGPGQIRDSNSTMVAALVAAAGGELHSRRGAGDSRAATVAAIEPGLTSADVVLVCGGVSVGEHDHVKGALAELGVEEDFWRVSLKPGGPLWFGGRGDTLVFGLPGNPVSVFVTFTLLAAPALRALAGGDPAARRVRATLAAAYEKRTGRAEAVRCHLRPEDEGWVADPRPHQGSHVLTSLLGADGLAILPEGERRFEAGERVAVELIDGADPGERSAAASKVER